MDSNPEKDPSTDTGHPQRAVDPATTDSDLPSTGSRRVPSDSAAADPTPGPNPTPSPNPTPGPNPTPEPEPLASESRDTSKNRAADDESRATRTLPAARREEPRTDLAAERRRAQTELELARADNRRLTDLGLLVIRLITAMLLIRGISKLGNFGAFRGLVTQSPIGQLAPDVVAVVQVVAEVALPVGLLLGLLTRLAGVLLAINMGTVWTLLHLLPNATAPINQQGSLHGEAALVFAMIGLALFLTGAGRFSIDRAVGRNRLRARAERRAERRTE